MDIWEENKLVLFVAFVIPGFVSLKVYELLFLRTSKDTANQLIDAVAYSCLTYAILFPAIYYVNSSKIESTHPIWFGFFWFFVLFIAPVIWVCALLLIRRSSFLQRWLPHPTEHPWDYVFGNKKPYWVIITMKDGKRLGGKYGYNSFSSSGTSKEQIYFEETWELNADGGFERAKDTTGGTLVVSSDIESIEFFHWT
jgi:Family of unknown function (DUF6338)